MARKSLSTLTDELKRAIEASGFSRYEISKATGVSQAALSRFVHGERTITLETADRLAAFLGLHLAQQSPSTRTR